MAGFLGKGLRIAKHFTPSHTSTRCITRSSVLGDNKEGWLSKLRKAEPTKESHSRMLSDKEVIYALNTHNVRPDSMDKYLKNYEENVNLIHSKKSELNCELVGSWVVEVGDLDQSLHLWRYTGGYKQVDKSHLILSKDQAYQKLFKEQGNYLRSRHLQYLLAFSYWPALTKRDGSNKYEIRSYILKHGTLYEWGNNWERGINYRRNNDEAFAGFFTQLGQVCKVYHIWCYNDLEMRKETRESAWSNPGWDDCVAYTVPLIREMHSRILIPNSFSPTK